MNEKEFDMIDAFVALKDLDDDCVTGMISNNHRRSARKLHEGKSYPIHGSREALEEARDFLNENDDVAIEVIDPDADSLEHVKDNIDYVGQMILRCNRCQANKFINMDALVQNPEDEETYNIDDECPNCKTSGAGYEIIGQVGKYEAPKAETEEPAATDDEAPEEEVAVENDEAAADEQIKFDNDEVSEEPAEIETEEEEAEPVEDEVVEVTDDDEETEPDMMETSSSEDDEDEIEVEEDEEDDDEEVKESLYRSPLYEDTDKAEANKKEALMYNKIADQMASDKVEDEWAPIWRKYESKISNLNTSDIVDLKYDFIEVYEKYHNDGLLAAESDVLKACAELDKELGLGKIENHRTYVESVEVISNTTISEVLGSVLDANKLGKIEITNRCDNKKDEKVYDGDYNNLPLNLANATCTGFDVNNRTLACNIDRDENHGRRPLADILDKFGDDKSDNIHLYDIESSEEVFKGKKCDAVKNFGNCGFISIDTPAVIRMTICDPSILSRVNNEDTSDASDLDHLVESIINMNNLSITRLNKVNSNEYWIKESIKEREDLEVIYEAYVKPFGRKLMMEFKNVTGYSNPIDEAFESGYHSALSESYSVAYGHGTSADNFDTLDSAISYINNGMQNRDHETFVLYNNGNEMIWIDRYAERDGTDLGYEVSRHLDKSVQFDQKNGITLTPKKYDEVLKSIILDYIRNTLREFGTAPKLAKFNFEQDRSSETHIDFAENVIYVNTNYPTDENAAKIIADFKSANEAVETDAAEDVNEGIFGFGKKKPAVNHYIVGMKRDRSGSLATADIKSKFRTILGQHAWDIKTSSRNFFAYYTLAQYEFKCTEDDLSNIELDLTRLKNRSNLTSDEKDAFENLFDFRVLESNVRESVEDESSEVDEDLADLYRKTFDKPASVETQQRWEDELNGEMGEISDKRRAHLEKKFAQQRDWEARHAAPETDTAVAEPELAGIAEGMSRDQMIDDLKAMGKSYYFDKYTDAQIYMIHKRALQRAVSKKAPNMSLSNKMTDLISDEADAVAQYDDAIDAANRSNSANKDAIVDTLTHIRDEEVEHIDEIRNIAECDRCGARLNDGGTCPACDHGEEDLTESLDNTMKSFVSDSISHLIDDLGYDSADEEFPEAVLADIEENYDTAAPTDPKEYAAWSSEMFEEINRQINAMHESIDESIDYDDWDEDDQVDISNAPDGEMDRDALRQIVNEEMPLAIKEWGTNVKALMGHFLTIMEEAMFPAPNRRDLEELINDYLAENAADIIVDESVRSFKSRKELAEAITECKNNSRPYTVRRSLKEGYRYDLILEADQADDSDQSDEAISDEEVEEHEDKRKSYSKDNKEDISKADGAEVIDKLSDASSYTEFVKILNKDRKSKAFLQYLKQHYKVGDDEIATVKASGASTAIAACSSLIPTQQNISLDKSLGMIKAGKSGWAVNIINNPATAFDDPTITYAGKYIIDGHHRWSKAYALVGPDAKIKVINFPAIDGVTWKDMLKAAQLAIVAKNPGGDLIHKVDNDNMLADTSGQAAADYYIKNADDNVVDAMKDKGFGDDKEAQGEHVKKNVAEMASAGVVSGAAPRAVMPQTDTAPGSVDLLKKAVIDLTEGDNLPVPAEETAVSLTAEEAEVNANIMRISQDIAQAIYDVYGIDADPALIVADILQDLGLITGDVRPEDLEDNALNRATLEMYRDHEAFWEFMDTLVTHLTGTPMVSTPETKIKRAINTLHGPSFSTEAIRKGIESTQFQRLAAQGRVPFIPAGSTPLLGEAMEEETIEIDTDKFDSDMNEYFNEAYDDSIVYTTTSGEVNPDGSMIFEGVIMSEDATNDIRFTLMPEEVLEESLETESDKTAKLESLNYVVTNDLSEEVFNFSFKD